MESTQSPACPTTLIHRTAIAHAWLYAGPSGSRSRRWSCDSFVIAACLPTCLQGLAHVRLPVARESWHHGTSYVGEAKATTDAELARGEVHSSAYPDEQIIAHSKKAAHQAGGVIQSDRSVCFCLPGPYLLRRASLGNGLIRPLHESFQSDLPPASSDIARTYLVPSVLW